MSGHSEGESEGRGGEGRGAEGGILHSFTSLAQMLKALQMCGANLDDYLHLLVPQIVKAYDLPDNPVDLRRWAESMC